MEGLATKCIADLPKQHAAKISTLSTELASLKDRLALLTARHQIHEKRDTEARLEAIEVQLRFLESQESVRELKRDVAHVLSAYDVLSTCPSRIDSFAADAHDGHVDILLQQTSFELTRNSQNNCSVVDASSADGTAFSPNDLNSQSSKFESRVESKLDTSHDAGLHVSSTSNTSNTSNTSSTINTSNTSSTSTSSRSSTPCSTPRQNTKSNVVRRRHVTKPNNRVLARGPTHASCVADTFLERHGMLATKPMCSISDTNCMHCGGKLVLDIQSDVYVCALCCFEQTTTQVSDHNFFNGGSATATNACRYTKETHFIHCLDCFSGNVGSEKITDSIMIRIMDWMVTNKLLSNCIRLVHVVQALVELGHRELKQHRVIILARITGVAPVSFSPEQRSQLIDMFRKASRAFDELLTEGYFPDRVNFLSYPYVIHKFLEMLTWGEKFKASFGVLSGDSNLEKQDEYWKLVCWRADFVFYPTLRVEKETFMSVAKAEAESSRKKKTQVQAVVQSIVQAA